VLPPVLIAPPFGNYLNVRGTTSVRGSFTAAPRPGLIINTIKSLRPIPGGWVNKIGLRNPGIRHIQFSSRKIISVAPMCNNDYDVFLNAIPYDSMVEVNLGCPNTDETKDSSPVGLTDLLKPFVTRYPLAIVKLPPTPMGMTYLGLAYRAGIRYFHMCNTIPVERGGESGDRLRDRSLEAIGWTRSHMPTDIRIIGGGGIYLPEHVTMYKDAGADHFSLGTACLKPWTIRALIKAAA